MRYSHSTTAIYEYMYKYIGMWLYIYIYMNMRVRQCRGFVSLFLWIFPYEGMHKYIYMAALEDDTLHALLAQYDRHLWVSIYLYTHTHIYMYICICICIHIHTYIHTYTYTHLINYVCINYMCSCTRGRHAARPARTVRPPSVSTYR